MKQESKNQPATKNDLKSLDQKFSLRMDKLEVRMDKLDKKIDKVEKSLKKEIKEKIATSERVLRAEIQLTAEQIKQEIKEEITRQNQKLLDTFDHFLVEIRASREERIIVSHQLQDHENRIENLEKFLPQPVQAN